jgi:hypothetical protein
MNRRDLVLGLPASVVLAASSRAFSQQTRKLPRIGILVSPSPPTSVRRRALARVARARLLGRQQHRHYTGGRSERGDVGEHPDEAPLLTLDAMRAHAILGWQPLLPFNEALTWTADWYRAFWDDKDIAVFTRRQIDVFSDRLARPAGERMTLRGTA